jgi:hypothetical protein
VAKLEELALEALYLHVGFSVANRSISVVISELIGRRPVR